jgi:hypothetical protein
LRGKQLEHERKEFEAARNGPTLSPEEQQEHLTESVTGELNTTFQWIESQPEFTALTAQEKRAVYDKFLKRPERLVRRAAQDDPAAGVKAGDLMFDPSDVLDDLKFIASVKPKPQPNGAAQRNAVMNADKANPIPPTVRSRVPAGWRSSHRRSPLRRRR